MYKRPYRFVLLLSLALAACDPSDKTEGLVSYGDFLDGVRVAEFERYAARDVARVRDRRTFEEMRTHILEMYDGAERTHSFELDRRVVDCPTCWHRSSVDTKCFKIRSTSTP